MNTLDELIFLSHELGREDRQLVILGEGNTSADIGDGTFWVKASGSRLEDIQARGSSRVRLEAVLDLINGDPLADDQVEKGLRQALVDATGPQPSVETFLHALCLTEGGCCWVGCASLAKLYPPHSGKPDLVQSTGS